MKHFAIPKLIGCWDEHFQSTLQCGEMVKAWTFHTVIFFPPGRVAGTCRAKEQLDCSCGFGAKVLKVYEIIKWKFQVNLQLTSWKALGWVQRIIIEFFSCQLFCILGNRQLEVQKAPLMHLIQAAHEVRSTCKRCRESTRYAWRGCQLKGLKGQSGSLVSSQELGSNHSFDVDTMHLFLVGSLTQKLFGSTQHHQLRFNLLYEILSRAMTWCGTDHFWG